MPCNCDHLEANALERETSKVACFLDELNGKDWSLTRFEGYHPAVYNVVTRELADQLTRSLCSKLKKLPKSEILKKSFELQIWWRDHQKADKEREKKTKRESKNLNLKKQALKKLTKQEKKALGL